MSESSRWKLQKGDQIIEIRFHRGKYQMLGRTDSYGTEHWEDISDIPEESILKQIKEFCIEEV